MSNTRKSERCKIMIFGAGINQVELIKEARELDVLSIVVDPQPDPPGKRAADFYYQVAGSDYEMTKRIAIAHGIDGIVTGQMEKPLRMMARLAHELQLEFHKPEIVEKCLDKWLMKKAFMLHSVACAKGKLIANGTAVNSDTLYGFNFPIIIKPRDAFSSRGVYKVNSLNELLEHIEEARSFSSIGDIIIEEFLEGREFSVETITWHGKTTVIQYTEKFITPYPNTVEMAHLQPAQLSLSEKEAIESLVISGIRSLDINNSAAHTEVMLCADGPKIIETGARLGGDFIASYLTKSSTGISMDRAAVQIALGLEPNLERNLNKYSMIRYLDLPIGKIVREVRPLDDLLKQPGIVFAWIYAQRADIISPITHSALRPGCIIVEAACKNDLIRLAQEALSELKTKLILS